LVINNFHHTNSFKSNSVIIDDPKNWKNKIDSPNTQVSYLLRKKNLCLIPHISMDSCNSTKRKMFSQRQRCLVNQKLPRHIVIKGGNKDVQRAGAPLL